MSILSIHKSRLFLYFLPRPRQHCTHQSSSMLRHQVISISDVMCGPNLHCDSGIQSSSSHARLLCGRVGSFGGAATFDLDWCALRAGAACVLGKWRPAGFGSGACGCWCSPRVGASTLLSSRPSGCSSWPPPRRLSASSSSSSGTPASFGGGVPYRCSNR